jgi:hypothetical protein
MSSSKYFKHIWDDTSSTIYEKYINKERRMDGTTEVATFIYPWKSMEGWVGTT